VLCLTCWEWARVGELHKQASRLMRGL
jgi:hypothetical protein